MKDQIEFGEFLCGFKVPPGFYCVYFVSKMESGEERCKHESTKLKMRDIKKMLCHEGICNHTSIYTIATHPCYMCCILTSVTFNPYSFFEVEKDYQFDTEYKY